MIDVNAFVKQASDILDMVANLLSAGGGIGVMTAGLMVIHALFRMRNMSKAQNQNDPGGWGGILGELCIAGILFQFSKNAEIIDNSLAFGATNIFVPIVGTATANITTALKGAISVGLWALGTISIFRGFLQFHKVSTGKQSSGDDLVLSGVWHIAGGSAARAISHLLV